MGYSVRFLGFLWSVITRTVNCFHDFIYTHTWNINEKPHTWICVYKKLTIKSKKLIIRQFCSSWKLVFEGFPVPHWTLAWVEQFEFKTSCLLCKQPAKWAIWRTMSCARYSGCAQNQVIAELTSSRQVDCNWLGEFEWHRQLTFYTSGFPPCLSTNFGLTLSLWSYFIES